MRFLIWAWDYGEDSGGGIALHRLAHNLATLGHFATLTCNTTADGWYGGIEGFRGARPGEIVIYPEIIEGNPQRGQRVVRWILNQPGFFGPGNGDGVYGADDLVMLWSRRFSVDPKYKIGGLLTAWRDLSHFRDYHRERLGACYIVRKGMGDVLNQHEAEGYCIDDYGRRGGDAFLIETFNRVESFVCYDDNSLMPTLAHLCGVPRIWIANGAKYMTRGEVLAATALADVQTREFVAACKRQWPA